MPAGGVFQARFAQGYLSGLAWLLTTCGLYAAIWWSIFLSHFSLAKVECPADVFLLGIAGNKWYFAAALLGSFVFAAISGVYTAKYVATIMADLGGFADLLGASIGNYLRRRHLAVLTLLILGGLATVLGGFDIITSNYCVNPAGFTIFRVLGGESRTYSWSTVVKIGEECTSVVNPRTKTADFVWTAYVTFVNGDVLQINGTHPTNGVDYLPGYRALGDFARLSQIPIQRNDDVGCATVF